MIKVDEEALICDLAETYRIYDYRSLPARTVAAFSCGLRDNSRIKLKINEEPVEYNTILLARLVDLLTAWIYAEASERPPSIVERMYNIEPKEKKEKAIAFDTGDDFINAWNRLNKGE